MQSNVFQCFKKGKYFLYHKIFLTFLHPNQKNMADSLIQLFRRRTVLIMANGAVGTGSLIAPGKVLTCAHVIRASAGDMTKIEVLMPDPSEPGHFLWREKALQVHLSKIYEEAILKAPTMDTEAPGVLKKEYPDVALIEIGKKDHPIIGFDQNDAPIDLRNRQFLAFGFQKKDRELQRNVPQAVSLNYSGEEGGSDVMRKLIFTNGLIRPGMSGAALIERESGKIIGIVQMTLSANDDLGAYVIPMDVIGQVFKKWEESKQNKLFSELQGKALKKQLRREYAEEYPRYPLYKKYGIRLIILPMVLFFGIWWIFYHLGQVQDSGIMAIALVALSISGKIMGDWLGEEINTESGKLRNIIGKKLFSRGFLIGLALLVGLLWSCTSSIWIYGNSDFEGTMITMEKEGAITKDTLRSLEKKRFVFFNPFLKDSLAIKLTPEGRETIAVHLKAFSKKELYYPRDFLLEPVVLIRFDQRFRRQMNKFLVEIRVERKGEPPMEYTVKDLKGIGGVVLGSRNLEVTDTRRSIWAKDFEKAPVALLNTWVSHWSEQRQLGHIDLERDDYIQVQVKRVSNDSVLNQQRYSIRKDTDTMDKLLKFGHQK